MTRERKPMLAGRAFALALLAALAVLCAAVGASAWARGEAPAEPQIPLVSLAELPPEARQTVQRIRAGGPFPYQRDGIVFRNFERLLPLAEPAYYREYTVPTPGLTHRGARRIVAGRRGELYYTDDHYRSFRRIRE